MIQSANLNLNLSLSFQQIVELVRQLPETQKYWLKEIIEKEAKKEEIQTHFATESVLAKDWFKPEEEEAWKDL